MAVVVLYIMVDTSTKDFELIARKVGRVYYYLSCLPVKGICPCKNTESTLNLQMENDGPRIFIVVKNPESEISL